MMHNCTITFIMPTCNTAYFLRVMVGSHSASPAFFYDSKVTRKKGMLGK